MSLGYRVFFVHSGDVHRISQRKFNALYLKSAESLCEYADQTLISVLVVYELVDRKPDCIVRMDTQKIRFDKKGFIDKAYEIEGLQLAASKMDELLGKIGISDEMETTAHEGRDQSTVVDASKRFNERRWNQRHPELSGQLLGKILTGIFGSSA